MLVSCINIVFLKIKVKKKQKKPHALMNKLDLNYGWSKEEEVH